MKHAVERRRPEIVYALLNIGLFAAIALTLWGAALFGSHLIHRWALTQQRPAYTKQIKGLTESISKDKDQKQILYWDYVRLGDVYVALEEFNQALPDYEAARGIAVSHALNYYVLLRLAGAYASAGNNADALKTLDAAIAAGPSSSAEALGRRAELFASTHRHDKAIADLDLAIGLSPDAPGYRLRRAALLAKSGAYGEAWAGAWAVVAQLRSASEVARLGREVADAQDKLNFEDAIAKESAIIALRPDNFSYLLQRSDFYLWTRQSDKAFADIAAARRLNPTSTTPRRYLGNAYEYMLEPGKALAELDSVVARDPEDGDLYRDLGLIKFKLARFSEAARDFAQAANLSAEPYSLIWLHLSNAASGAKDSKDFKATIDAILSDVAEGPGKLSWPYPVLQFFTGRIQEADMVKAAERTEKDAARRDQRCEALFYAGLSARLRGNAAHGTDLIKNAHALCHPGFIEYIAASWELRDAKSH